MAGKIKQIVWDVKARNELITTNMRLNDTRYGSWKAISVGLVAATVDGVELQPGEGLQWDLQPNECWQEPIDIVVPATAAVRLIRKICTPRVVTVTEQD